MSDENRDREHAERNRLQKDMRQQEQREFGQQRQAGAGDHHGLGRQHDQSGLADSDKGGGNRQQGWSGDVDEAGRQFDQSGFAEGSQTSDGSRQMGWNQNADDTGRQYDPSGFAQGGQDQPQQGQGWAGETHGDRQQFQSEYDEQIEDDGSMTREQKLQQGWQDPGDPSQIADEGLIDEDEQDRQGGRI